MQLPGGGSGEARPRACPAEAPTGPGAARAAAACRPRFSVAAADRWRPVAAHGRPRWPAEPDSCRAGAGPGAGLWLGARGHCRRLTPPIGSPGRSAPSTGGRRWVALALGSRPSPSPRDDGRRQAAGLEPPATAATERTRSDAELRLIRPGGQEVGHCSWAPGGSGSRQPSTAACKPATPPGTGSRGDQALEGDPVGRGTAGLEAAVAARAGSAWGDPGFTLDPSCDATADALRRPAPVPSSA